MELIFELLNNNKLFMACIMIFMNIGNKHIWRDMPKSIDNIFENVWLRRLVIFSMIFVTIHDIKLSLLLTLIIVIILHCLLNDKNFNQNNKDTKDDKHK